MKRALQILAHKIVINGEASGRLYLLPLKNKI